MTELWCQIIAGVPNISRADVCIHSALGSAILPNLSERGALGRIRTCDLPFRRGLLYPLSYEGAVHARGAHRGECSGNGGALAMGRAWLSQMFWK